MAHEIW